MKNIVKQIFYWLIRRKSPALYIIRTGLTIVSIAVINWALSISIPSRYGAYEFTFNSEGNTPIFITYVLFDLGIALIIIGAIWEVIRYQDEKKKLSRKRVIVIEARGLRDTNGAPLIEAVPSYFQGHRENLLIDLRQRVKDGIIIDPEASIDRLMAITHQTDQFERGLDRCDITTIYGGMAPVPYTFLTGVLLDDEGVINIFDWDRSKEAWRPLDEPDDNRRFFIEKIEDIFPIKATEVALAVSVSYQVELSSIKQKYRDFPLIHLKLEDGSPDSHWSEEKQRELGKQFLNTLIELGNYGFKRIHLFIAAPNSLVFRFGRLYDKRNLPEVVVYQYQREKTPAHPWGILMPTSGITQPRVV